MSREKSFLDRMADLGKFRTRGPTAGEDLEALAESVRENLARILNARQGMSEALPDYGLPSLVDLTMSSGNYVQVVRETIRTAIEKYEPRLRRIRVSEVHDDEDLKRQTLVFRIDATLVSRSGEHRVWYETALRGSGEFDVSG